MCNAVQHVTGANYKRHLLVGVGTACVMRYSMLQALTMRDICWWSRNCMCNAVQHVTGAYYEN